jgi:hypothetical protein
MINVSRYNQFAIQGNLMQSDIWFMIDSMTSLNFFLKSRIDLYEKSYQGTVRYFTTIILNWQYWMITLLTSYVTIVLALSTFMNICTCSILRWLPFNSPFLWVNSLKLGPSLNYSFSKRNIFFSYLREQERKFKE